MVKTFDQRSYTYTLNDCEHIVFADKTIKPRIVITTRKSQHKQSVKMIVDGHNYEISIENSLHGPRAAIKVDEQAIKLVNGTKKENGFLDKFYSLKYNVYTDMDTFVTNYIDGVYSIYSR